MNSKRNGTARLTLGLAAATMAVAVTSAAQQPSVVVHDDKITIRGCVGSPAGSTVPSQEILVWTRGDIMLRNAMAVHGATSSLGERVFYWLDDDDDLSKHTGKMVEIKGDLDDFEKGEVEIDRDGDFTKIELKLDGKTEKARVPTSWLGTPVKDGDFDIVSRKIDVDDVKVIGPCSVP